MVIFTYFKYNTVRAQLIHFVNVCRKKNKQERETNKANFSFIFSFISFILTRIHIIYKV